MKNDRANISWPDGFGLLLATWLAIWVQASFDVPRNLLGARLDLLGGLVVCAALRHGIPGVLLTAFTGGFLFDVLSLNRLGSTSLPLLLVGGFVHANRQLLLCDRVYPQAILGACAGLVVIVLQWLLIVALRQQPLTGPGTFWQIVATAAMGGVVTPVWFGIGRVFERAVQYPSLSESSFRKDREIVRGRS